MKIGMSKAETPEVNTKDLGKAVFQVLGVGLAAGVALIAATDKVLKKVTGGKNDK